MAYRLKEVFNEYKRLPEKAQDIIVKNLLFGTVKPPEVRRMIEESETCESPIEKIFLIAYDTECYFRDDINILVNLQSQVTIKCKDKTYIADFLFETNNDFWDFCYPEHDLKLIIECDGYEYHNATKEQVSHDNERDYDLKMEGYEVLHFSGSQIVKDPMSCAFETVNYIYSRLGEIRDYPDHDTWVKIQEKRNGNIS